MAEYDEELDYPSRLRRRAEDALRGKPVDLEGLAKEDILYLLRELQVYRAQLSLQNDELRRTKMELEASRDRFAHLYNYAPAGYCTLSRNGHILEANQTLANMLGVERNKLHQKKFSDYVDRRDQAKYHRHIQNALTGPQPQVGEIQMKTHAGEFLNVRLESGVADGDESRIRVIVSDITKLQMLEKEAQEIGIRQELRQRISDKREQNHQQVGRDLQEGPIQGMVAILFDLHSMWLDNPNSGIAQQLEAIERDMKQRIRELRDFASELRPPTLSRYGLEVTIRSHADYFERKYPYIILRLELEDTGPLPPEAISSDLFRIYQEALANIVKHVKSPNIEVVVHLTKDGNLVRLEIMDNGPGFDLPDNLIDLVHEGHLGLLGMRERAEAHGGTFEVHSTKGVGTRVLVIVPWNQSPAE